MKHTSAALNVDTFIKLVFRKEKMATAKTGDGEFKNLLNFIFSTMWRHIYLGNVLTRMYI